MSDEALMAWLNAGAPAPLSAEESDARRRAEFVRRFSEALDPPFDLGPTSELHEQGIARAVWRVHSDLNLLGEVAYSDVWQAMSAPVRRAIKAYVAMKVTE